MQIIKQLPGSIFSRVLGCEILSLCHTALSLTRRSGRWGVDIFLRLTLGLHIFLRLTLGFHLTTWDMNDAQPWLWSISTDSAQCFWCRYWGRSGCLCTISHISYGKVLIILELGISAGDVGRRGPAGQRTIVNPPGRWGSLAWDNKPSRRDKSKLVVCSWWTKAIKHTQKEKLAQVGVDGQYGA